MNAAVFPVVAPDGSITQIYSESGRSLSLVEGTILNLLALSIMRHGPHCHSEFLKVIRETVDESSDEGAQFLVRSIPFGTYHEPRVLGLEQGDPWLRIIDFNKQITTLSLSPYMVDYTDSSIQDYLDGRFIIRLPDNDISELDMHEMEGMEYPESRRAWSLSDPYLGVSMMEYLDLPNALTFQDLVEHTLRFEIQSTSTFTATGMEDQGTVPDILFMRSSAITFMETNFHTAQRYLRTESASILPLVIGWTESKQFLIRVVFSPNTYARELEIMRMEAALGDDPLIGNCLTIPTAHQLNGVDQELTLRVVMFIRLGSTGYLEDVLDIDWNDDSIRLVSNRGNMPQLSHTENFMFLRNLFRSDGSESMSGESHE